MDKGTTNAAGTTFAPAETATTAFDPNGNKTQVSLLNGTFGSAALSVTQMNYDGLNRVICTAARENAAVFNALPDACTQSAGGQYGPDPITMIAYDLAGQELTETRDVGTSLMQAYTTFTWGQDGEKLSVTDANSNTIHLGYDGFNRLNLITHPDSTTETSQYDPDGDLVIWTNRGGFGVVRCYDVLNRKLSETGITGATLSGACATGGTLNTNTRSWDIQARTFGYDLAGRLTGASIPGFPLTYAYDAAGRPTSRGGAWSAGYGWDNAGNLQTLTYPDGSTTVTYQYDPLNRTTGALIGTKSYGALSYDPLGRRQTLTFVDGSSQAWNYDNADRVTSIAHVFPNDTGHNVTFSYSYDPTGRDASKTVSDTADYGYSPTAGATTYATANALNQYPSVNSYAYSYWPEGGLKQTDTFQANYNELGKAALNYITPTPGTVDPNNFDIQGTDALDHVYFHYRQTTAGQNYPFIYHATDGLRPETIWEWVCNQTGGNTPVCAGSGLGPRYYVLGPDADERWAFVGVNGGIYAPHTDREGTMIAIANGGQAKATYAYDAYGQNTSAASDTGTGPSGYLYRYTGQRLDPNTSLYDYKAREYSPGLGRFLQPDPAGLDQGPNLYEYVGDEPVVAGDPTGDATPQQPPPHVYTSDCGGALHVNCYGGGASNFSISKPTLENKIINAISEGRAETIGEYLQALGKEGLGALEEGGIEGIPPIAKVELGAGKIGEAAEDAFAAVARCCFAAGTLVETDHGLQPIEQIKVGDRVLSRDELTGVTQYKPVLSLIRPHHRQIFSLSLEVGQLSAGHRTVFSVTDDHPWRTVAGRWVQTIALTPRDQIIRAHGPPARVISVRHTARFESTYNLEVADFHTYFVGRDLLWVHNACPGLWDLTRAGASKIMQRGGNTYYKSASDGLWWVKDTAGHGGSKFLVYREGAKGLEFFKNADQYGNFIVGKFKSAAGAFVPW